MVRLWGNYPDRIRGQGIGHRRDRFLVRSVSNWNGDGKAIASPAVYSRVEMAATGKRVPGNRG
ncbi:hypothetical protein GCM10009113_25940 [Marinobacter szutsaonensis]